MTNILIITAHPDDEIIWFGSTIFELNKIENINISIICLWGILEPPGSMKAIMSGYKDIDRKKQFCDVCELFSINKFFIITEVDSLVYKNINQTYDNILHEFNKVLNIIDLKNIDMIISHSFYGDERKHNGHIITHNFAKKYCNDNNIPFSFFSILQIPDLNHKSILKNTYKLNDLHIINYSICNNNLFYILFQGNLKKKIEALNLYKAINVNEHIKYIMSCTVGTEGLYCDINSKKIFDTIIEKMNKISCIF